MRARDADGNDVLPRLRKARAVLAILALAAPRPVLRSRLSALLWSLSDPFHALVSLRMAVSELKAALGPEARLLRAGRTDIALGATELRVDARQVVSAGSAPPDSLASWSGAFLPDLVGLDPALDRWLSEQQQGLTRQARGAAEANLTQACGLAATAAAGRLLALDPAHEGAWRALIRAHLARGDRAAAIAAFAQCRIALSEHLQVEPSPETTALVAEPRTAPISSLEIPAGRGAARLGLRARGIRVGVANVHGDGDACTVARAAALTAELIAALSCFRWLACGPGTAAHAEASIDFLLTGAVRRHGGRLRVLLRLMDQRAGGIVVWSERYDSDIAEGIGSLLQVAGTTAARIESRLWHWRGERAGADDMAARSPRDLVRLAAPMVHRLDRDGFMTAGKWLKRAVELDPNDASAHAWFVQWCLHYVGQGWAADPAAGSRRARDLAERTIELEPEDARGLTLAGHVHAFLDHRPDEALRLHERAIAANPNLPLGWCLSGLAESYVGNGAEGVRRIRHGRTLSPGDPLDYFAEMALCIANLLSGEYEAAAASGQRAIALNPGFSSSHKGYLAAMGHLGRRDAAAASLATLLKLEPGFSVEDAVRRSPFATAGGRALYADGLLTVGLRRTPRDH